MTTWIIIGLLFAIFIALLVIVIYTYQSLDILSGIEYHSQNLTGQSDDFPPLQSITMGLDDINKEVRSIDSRLCALEELEGLKAALVEIQYDIRDIKAEYKFNRKFDK